MARPKKERVICSSPRYRYFCPMPDSLSESLLVQADEYEVLRLHDLEHLSQAEVAAQMLISRPTVASLLASAHQKLADAIVNGKAVSIEDCGCMVCEIGAACPAEKKAACEKRQRCGASCRAQKSCPSKK